LGLSSLRTFGRPRTASVIDAILSDRPELEQAILGVTVAERLSIDQVARYLRNGLRDEGHQRFRISAMLETLTLQRTTNGG
jgi:hypothetical protein